MPTTQQLREQRANIWEQMKEIMDVAEREGRDLTGEEVAKYDRAESDFDRLEVDIARQERHEARADGAERMGRIGAGGPDLASVSDGGRHDDAAFEKAWASFIRRGTQNLGADDAQALQSRFVAGDAFNAAGVGTAGAGGYTVPAAFRDVIIETAKWYGPMLTEAEVLYTDTGANLPWPKNDDTANEGAILGENTQVTEQDVTFGVGSLDAFMYTSKLVRASYQFLQDSGLDVDVWLARKLGERIGRVLNRHFTVGTGTGEPDGIITSSTVGVTGTGSFATTGGVAYDNLVDIVEALDPAYGNANDGTSDAPGLKWMMHQSARKAVRKLKDGQSRPLWEPSLQAGLPDTLLGYPVRINNHMDALAVGSKSVGFGNIRSAYAARIVRDVSMLRLTERYADFLQVGFLGFARADGTLQDPAAFTVFQSTATA